MENEKICKNCRHYEADTPVSGLCKLHNFGTRDKPKYVMVVENWEQCFKMQGENQ